MQGTSFLSVAWITNASISRLQHESADVTFSIGFESQLGSRGVRFDGI